MVVEAIVAECFNYGTLTRERWVCIPIFFISIFFIFLYFFSFFFPPFFFFFFFFFLILPLTQFDEVNNNTWLGRGRDDFGLDTVFHHVPCVTRDYFSHVHTFMVFFPHFNIWSP